MLNCNDMRIKWNSSVEREFKSGINEETIKE